MKTRPNQGGAVKKPKNPTNVEAMRVELYTARDAIGRAIALLPPEPEPPEPPSDVHVVHAGDDLQAAIDTYPAIRIESGAVFEQPLVFGMSDRTVLGAAGVVIRGGGAPAVTILAGTHRIGLTGVELASTHNCVAQVGDNETTTVAADAPTAITFEAVRVPTHRGKRAFELHGSVTLLDCEALDIWDPGGRDSQAIYIGNSPGKIRVFGGRYSAGSEVVLVGGAATMIPGLVPTDLEFANLELFRPLSWQTDGVARKVKNIFEVKSGRQIRLTNSVLNGVWKEGQQGEAIMLTPTVDGDKQDPPLVSHVSDVTIEDCLVTNCGSIVNLIGRDYSTYTQPPATGFVFRRITGQASCQQFGGRGVVIMAGVELGTLTFEDSVVFVDGDSTVYTHIGDGCTGEDGAYVVPRYAVQELGLRNNWISVLGPYGMNLEGYSNSRQMPAGTTIDGNVFGTGPKTDPNEPARLAEHNQCLPEAEFEQLERVQAARELLASVN